MDKDWTVTDLYSEALRENWARTLVAAAGKDWATHMMKFSGAVIARAYIDEPHYLDYEEMRE